MEAAVEGCPFCQRISAGEYDRRYNGRDGWDGAVVFEPLNPVTPGHLLVVSVSHVEHAAKMPYLTASVMESAATEARFLQGDANIITSIGSAATQTVKHLHVHVVPRRAGDGLHLPWTGQPR
jgi:histidine triad (HIT) family protein